LKLLIMNNYKLDVILLSITPTENHKFLSSFSCICKAKFLRASNIRIKTDTTKLLLMTLNFQMISKHFICILKLIVYWDKPYLLDLLRAIKILKTIIDSIIVKAFLNFHFGFIFKQPFPKKLTCWKPQ
jgi:hypothetical protein